MTDKPKVFISSIIYDFYDLRSAIKYYLESLGYEVFLSEYNDFPKELDLSSYEDCLKTIEDVQYFILLIGSRVGGFYDKEKRISITQQEYRKAYDELKKGKLKIINIVRENLWLARNERKELQKILIEEYKKRYELSDEDIKNIKNFESEIVNNAEFTFSFIKEIARVEEMKDAQTSGNFPIGNWIHQFKTFSDIVDILKKTFEYSGNLETMALKANLKYEIIQNMKLLFQKLDDGKIHQVNIYADKVAEKYDGKLEGESSFSREDFKLFPLFIISGIGKSSNLKTEFLDYSLHSGKFLEFDNSTGKYKQSFFSNALIKLKEYIGEINSLVSMPQLSAKERLSLIDKFKSESDVYYINNLILFPILAIHKLHDKIINLSYAILLDIEGDFDLLKDYKFDDSGPSKKISDELKAYDITEGDFYHYLHEQLKKRKKNKS